MKNKLTDLNNHLFAQLERLSDEELAGDALTTEIERSRAITGVAREIVSNANTVLKGMELARDINVKAPDMLGIERQ